MVLKHGVRRRCPFLSGSRLPLPSLVTARPMWTGVLGPEWPGAVEPGKPLLFYSRVSNKCAEPVTRSVCFYLNVKILFI